jgi:hypothetical protein
MPGTSSTHKQNAPKVKLTLSGNGSYKVPKKAGKSATIKIVGGGG